MFYPGTKIEVRSGDVVRVDATAFGGAKGQDGTIRQVIGQVVAQFENHFVSDSGGLVLQLAYEIIRSPWGTQVLMLPTLETVWVPIDESGNGLTNLVQVGPFPG